MPMSICQCIALGLCACSVPVVLADDELRMAAGDAIRIGEQTLSYSIEAARLPIRDMESGELRGKMFYVAYRMPSPDAEPRPVTFAWGGGPSGPALRAHMRYGPKQVTDDGRITDNSNTLLPATDLVFVDPVGTGFSRPAKPEFIDEFYNTIGDARAMAEFIRVWLARNDAFAAPVFLNGQSYGVWRAAIVAELLEKSGRRVSGVILTSGGMGLADEFTERPFEIAYRVPDYAAVAFHHGRLPEEFGDDVGTVRSRAEAWAREHYGPALKRISELSRMEREGIATDLSRWTAYPLDRIDRKTLVFTPPQYLSNAIIAGESNLNLFDMRTMRSTESATNASLDAAQSRYLRQVVGYKTDLAYIGLEAGYTPTASGDYTPIGQRWVYNSGNGEGARAAAAAAGEGPPGKEPWLRRAIDSNTDLRAFVAAGIYDGLNFCAANEDRVRRMPTELADNFQLQCYQSGHSIYFDGEAYPLLAQDIRQFILSR